MPREAGSFEAANGSIVEAYFLLRNSGKNIPPAWIDRATESRKRRQKSMKRSQRACNIAIHPELR